MKKVIIISALFCLAGTGVFAQIQTTSVSGDKNSHDAINQILENSSATANLQTTQTENEQIPNYIIANNMAYELRTQRHTVNDSKQEIFAENLENIYPGAVVYADADLANGDPTLVGLDYGTVTVRVDFNTGKNSTRKGVKNSPDAIQEAIHSILKEASYKPSVNFNYKKSYASSVSEMAVNLNVNANFLKIKANVKTSVNNKESSITEVEDYTQKYYTVSITQESDKSKYFGPNVTGLDVQNKLKKAPLAIITSVTYGRRAYRFKDFSSSDFKFNGKESVTAYGQSASSTQDIAQKSSATNEWMWISGSDASSSAQILKGGNINTAISSALQFNANTNQGTPLYYTVRYLATGKIATIKSTGEYTTVEYVPMPKMVTCTFRNNCTRLIGAGLRVRLDYKVSKFSRGRKGTISTPRGVIQPYSRSWEQELDFGVKGTTKTITLNLGDGEYLDGPIRLQIRSKYSAAESWHDDLVGFIYPENGVIDLEIEGSIIRGGAAAHISDKSKTQLLKQ